MTAQPLPQIDRDNWRKYAAPELCPTQWTAVIAAAGKGSRLGYHLPKILFPVAGRPMLEWLLDLVQPFCGTAVFVLSPDGGSHVEPLLQPFMPGRYRIVTQAQPKGMGDAVSIGAANVVTPYTAVIWGDQVALRADSVAISARLHTGYLQPDLTIPTVLRDRPYIHFERHLDGRISRLLQAREGDSMPSRGESDAGFFCFKTEVLRRLLEEIHLQAAAQGARTAEFNLLPVIPYAAQHGYKVLTPHIMDVAETVGINSPADAELVAQYLRRADV